MAHGGGHGGHGFHGGSTGFGATVGRPYYGFSPIFPLLFYPMMGYWLLRQNYTAQATAQGIVDFSAKLSFVLEWQMNSSVGFISEQSIVQEMLLVSDFVSKLQDFFQKSEFRKISAIYVDGREIYRSPNQAAYLMSDNLQMAFNLLQSEARNAASVAVVSNSEIGNFLMTMSINFASSHPASQSSVECFLDALPRVYVPGRNETPRDAASRINQFNLMMQNSFDRSAFVVQERDLLIPLLEKLAANFSSIYKVRAGKILLFEGRRQMPIWRGAVAQTY